jgi:hypothetical protein
MNTTFQTTTIGDFLDMFAGRRDFPGYDETKPIKIAECNRDFVWPLGMQQDFIKSILHGFPIPAMCITNEQIVDGGNRSTTLWLFHQNLFMIKMLDDGPELNYDRMCEDRALTRRWDSAVIPQQMITNATADQFAQIYENLNKGIRLSFGQLLENRRYRPWVAMAESILKGAHPHMELIQRAWSSRFKKTKNRNELGFAFQVLAGAERGPVHFHTSFTEHLPLIMSDVPPTTTKLRDVLEMMAACDPDGTVSSKKKKDIFGKFIGAIIYDMHTMEHREWYAKWTEFLPEAYNTMTQQAFKMIADVGNMRASINSRIAGVSENVWRFMNNELVVTAEDDTSEEDSD